VTASAQAVPIVDHAAGRNQSRYNAEFLHKLRTDMLDAAGLGYSALRHVLPPDLACSIIEDAFLLLKAEPTMLEVHVHIHTMQSSCTVILIHAGRFATLVLQLHFEDPEVEVIVVGDTHGQFHDVCKL
jgi:hypothetical protein